MSFILVNHKVKDYSAWRPYFDNDIPLQLKSGIKLRNVFSAKNDPSDIYILFETSDLEEAQKFFTNPRLKELMQKAGVISEPVVQILESV